MVTFVFKLICYLDKGCFFIFESILILKVNIFYSYPEIRVVTQEAYLFGSISTKEHKILTVSLD